MVRRWLLWILAIAFGYLVVSRFGEIQNLAETLAKGQIQWIFAAAALQGLYYIVWSASYKYAFYAVEVQSQVFDLLPVVIGSIFVNVIAPAGGTAGAALFMDDAARRGESPTKTAAGVLLQLLSDFAMLTLLVIIGLFYLSLQHELHIYEVLGSIVLFLMVLSQASILMLGFWKPDWLERLMAWFQRTTDRVASLLHRDPFLVEGWSEMTSTEFSGAAITIASHPRSALTAAAVTLGGHLVDMASLGALFLAFGQQIGIGALIAGFSIGILFRVVSITPQGIGIVEGVMVLLFTSFGVPSGTATIVTLAFRGMTFWLPMIIGFLLIRRMRSFTSEKKTMASIWEVKAVALLTAVMGLINMLSAAMPAVASRLAILDQFAPLEVRQGSHLATALAGFALLVLAEKLWRGKRNAWLITLIVLGISFVTHMLKGLDYEEALLALGLAIWLWRLKPHFSARSDRPSIEQGLLMLFVSFFFTLIYGTAGFYLLDRHYQINFGLSDALRQTVIMFTQFYDPGLHPITGFGRFFADSIYVVGAATFGYAFFMLLRPVVLRRQASPAERERAKSIVEAYGNSELARMALFEDKSYFFSPGGSVSAYVVEGNVAIALGDPIGPPADIPEAISQFRKMCFQNDWHPAFYQVMPDYLDIYRENGLDEICIGQEAVVDLEHFSLEGHENKNVRTSVNKLVKFGYHSEVVAPPADELLLEQLRIISDEWLSTRQGGEKKFSMGWFNEKYLKTCPIMLIWAPDGTITAFANLVTEYHRDELTIDLMRHRKDAINGTMDFLFVSMFEWAKEQGYRTFNLGLSPLSGVGEGSSDPTTEKALHYVFEHLNQFYNFKGLRAFKGKFHPAWSPRYLVYPGSSRLLAVTIALVRVDSSEGLSGYIRR
jgi:phosphatidylglycerol lysyltransferase